MATPLGPLWLAASEKGLCGVWFDGQKHLPDVQRWPRGSNALLALAAEQLQQYFARQRRTFDLPLDMDAGTPFQQSVWQALLTIGCGQQTSYGALAQRLGKPQAARAVGAAVGRNPLGIIVPCHRVSAADGALTGFAGGLARKAALLALEACNSNMTRTPSHYNAHETRSCL